MLLEHGYLPLQVTDNSVDLFDHSLGQNLRLDSDFNIRGWAPSHNEILFNNCNRRGHKFAKRTVTAACCFPNGHIL